jgi:hypothetical protein
MEVTKNIFIQLRGKNHCETVEETLFANRKSKEKNAPSI